MRVTFHRLHSTSNHHIAAFVDLINDPSYERCDGVKNIFISYSRTDTDYAMRFADDMERRGFNVWIDCYRQSNLSNVVCGVVSTNVS